MKCEYALSSHMNVDFKGYVNSVAPDNCSRSEARLSLEKEEWETRNFSLHSHTSREKILGTTRDSTVEKSQV